MIILSRKKLTQNQGAFRRVEGQKGYWRLTPAGVISVESTTSYRKDRESKNHSPSRAKAKRELSESERRKRQEAGAKGGHASANSRRVHDKQKQQAARRSKRTRGQPVNYNEDAIMMTPDMSMDMQLDFGAYPDSYSGQGNHAFDMSRFDDMRSNSGTSSGTPPLIQSTTPSSLSNTATPPQGAYDSLFHQDYSGFDFSDMTMDSNMFSNMGYHEVSAELNANYQPATYDTWPSEHPTSSQGYSTNSQPTAAATNNGMADSNSTPPYTSAFSSNGNDMYQPFSLYNNYDPYQSSNIMPAFSHTASLPGDLPGASPGLDNGYLTTPASSGGMLTANDGTMGRAQSRRMRVHGPGRLNRAQQPPRMNGYAPNVPSGLSRANTPAPSPEVVGGYVDLGKEMQTDDVQMRAVESENDAIDPQLFFHEWSSEGMVDLSGTGSAVSTAERRDHMEYVLGGQH